MKKTKKRVTNILYAFLMSLLSCVFFFSAYMLYSELKSYSDDEKAYEELEQYVEIEQPSVQGEELPFEQRVPKIDFESLKQINSDCTGWIYIPNTKISYPVVYTDNNDYYLKHLFNKKYGISGTVFVDARNSIELTDRHTIFYAHHMKNGTMFADVEEYKNQSFADEHPTGMYITPEKVYDITFFAGYLTDPYNDSWMLNFTDEEFTEWIERSKQRSHFSSDVTVDADDRIVTLSTCSYDIADGRFVLLGILTEREEQ